MTDRRNALASDVPADILDDRAEDEPRLVVDVGGFEGPLDLLLTLARQQKVDLARISILALAEQYLAFIAEARALRLELAADYLLMAAWLAYLKSRLLIPEKSAPEEPSGEDLAEALARRLRRLELMRHAGERLLARSQLGSDVHARGLPETLVSVHTSLFEATYVDLLKAYATQRARNALARVSMPKRRVWSLADARAALQRLVGVTTDWTRLDHVLLEYLVEPESRATVLASSFASSLELVREGVMELRQEAAFRPIYARRRAGAEGGGEHG